MPKILLYNIAYGQGLDGKKHKYLQFWRRLRPPKMLLNSLARAIGKHAPDIVALVEVDIGNPNKINQISYIKQHTRLPFSDANIKYGKVGIGKLLLRLPIMRRQGNGIISRYPLSDIIYHTLPRGTKKMAAQYTVQCGKNRVVVFLVHLPLGRAARSEQLKSLANIIKKVKEPVICLGDFNTSRTKLREFLAQTHLSDPHFTTNAKTFPSFNPKKKLDYVLVSKHIHHANATILPWLFSDHLPLSLDFSIASD